MTWPLADWPPEAPPNCSNRRCMRPSGVAVDGEPYCLACADELLERFVAVSLTPELREQLPQLWES